MRGPRGPRTDRGQGRRRLALARRVQGGDADHPAVFLAPIDPPEAHPPGRRFASRATPTSRDIGPISSYSNEVQTWPPEYTQREVEPGRARQSPTRGRTEGREAAISGRELGLHRDHLALAGEAPGQERQDARRRWRPHGHVTSLTASRASRPSRKELSGPDGGSTRRSRRRSRRPSRKSMPRTPPAHRLDFRESPTPTDRYIPAARDAGCPPDRSGPSSEPCWSCSPTSSGPAPPRGRATGLVATAPRSSCTTEGHDEGRLRRGEGGGKSHRAARPGRGRRLQLASWVSGASTSKRVGNSGRGDRRLYDDGPAAGRPPRVQGVKGSADLPTARGCGPGISRARRTSDKYLGLEHDEAMSRRPPPHFVPRSRTSPPASGLPARLAAPDLLHDQPRRRRPRLGQEAPDRARSGRGRRPDAKFIAVDGRR